MVQPSGVIKVTCRRSLEPKEVAQTLVQLERLNLDHQLPVSPPFSACLGPGTKRSFATCPISDVVVPPLGILTTRLGPSEQNRNSHRYGQGHMRGRLSSGGISLRYVKITTEHSLAIEL